MLGRLNAPVCKATVLTVTAFDVTVRLSARGTSRPYVHNVGGWGGVRAVMLKGEIYVHIVMVILSFLVNLAEGEGGGELMS